MRVFSKFKEKRLSHTFSYVARKHWGGGPTKLGLDDTHVSRLYRHSNSDLIPSLDSEVMLK